MRSERADVNIGRTILRLASTITLASVLACGPAPRSASPTTAPEESASAPGALAFDAVHVPSHEPAFDREVLFAPGSSEPLASSSDALDEIVRAMAATPEVSLLAVMGSAASNERPEMADERATRVIALLAAHGVEKSRLAARRFKPPVEARCGVTDPSEAAVVRERELARARAVHFAIARADERR